MLAKATLALAFALAITSGALATKKQSFAQHHDVYHVDAPSIQNKHGDPAYAGCDNMRVFFPSCSGGN
jgi:hypothetical protein